MAICRFNKNESHLRITPVYQELLERKHVLLVGDGAGDASMADGLPHSVVLRFGIINHTQPLRFLERYSALFDAVIMDPVSMAPVLDVLCRAAP